MASPIRKTLFNLGGSAFDFLFDRTKDRLQSDLDSLKSLFAPKKAQEFKVGEGLTPSQARIAQAEVRRPVTPPDTNVIGRRAKEFSLSPTVLTDPELKAQTADIRNEALQDAAFNMIQFGTVGKGVAGQITGRVSPGVRKKVIEGVVSNIPYKKNALEFIGNINKSKLSKPVAKKLTELVLKTGVKLEQNKVALSSIDALSKKAGNGDKIIEEILNLPEGGFAGEIRKTSNKLAETLVNTNNTIEQRLAAAQQSSRIRAEAGRAVTQFREPIINGQIIKDQLEKEIAGATDPITKKALQKILDLSNISKSIPNLWDKIIEAATAAKLTSPITFVRNAVGNTITRILAPVEKTIAGAVSGIESGLTGKARERFIGEGLQDVFGTVRSLENGARKFWAGLLDESITSSSFKSMEVSRKGPAIKGLKGKVIRAPFRLLGAADEASKTIGMSAEMQSLAYRTAKQEGLSGPGLWARIDELVKNPTKEMTAQAQEATLESVFQKKLGPAGGAVQKAIEKTGAKIVIPFFRTPVNLFKYSFQRGQLGFLSPTNLKDIFAGGQTKRASGIAKLVMGQITGAYLAWQAAQGNITGRGPENASERDALYRTGWQPNSIKLNKPDGTTKYVSYSGFEPLSFHLSLAAEIAEQREGEDEMTNVEKAEALSKAIAKNTADQPFATGMKNLLDAWADPDRSGTFLENFIGGLAVPTGVAFTENLIDPTIRQSVGLKERIQAKIPFISDELPPRRDALGEPIIKEGTLLQRLSPAAISTESISAVDKELAELGITLSLPQKSIDGVKLTSKELSTLLEGTGTIIKGNINNLLNSEGYSDLPPDTRKSMVKNQINTIGVQVIKKQIQMNTVLRGLDIEMSPNEKKKIFPQMYIIMGSEAFKALSNDGKRATVKRLLSQ